MPRAVRSTDVEDEGSRNADETKKRRSGSSMGHDCHICRKSNMTLSGLKIHLLTHSGVKPFLCTVCDKRFTCSSNLKKHQRIHNKDYIYECPVCRKTCSDPSNMKKHMTVHSNEKAHVCPSCGKSYRYAQSLRQHMDDVHVCNGEKRQKRKRKGTFPCPECGKVFGYFWRCSLHQARVHAVEKPFKCPECGKAFARETILNKHIQTHEKRFQCTICERKFSFTDQLKKHQRTHSGEKPYQCEQCLRSFSQRGSLTEHMRTHTGIRPFSCTNCGQKFSSSSSLRRHERKVKSCLPSKGEDFAEQKVSNPITSTTSSNANKVSESSKTSITAVQKNGFTPNGSTNVHAVDQKSESVVMYQQAALGKRNVGGFPGQVFLISSTHNSVPRESGGKQVGTRQLLFSGTNHPDNIPISSCPQVSLNCQNISSIHSKSPLQTNSMSNHTIATNSYDVSPPSPSPNVTNKSDANHVSPVTKITNQGSDSKAFKTTPTSAEKQPSLQGETNDKGITHLTSIKYPVITATNTLQRLADDPNKNMEKIRKVNGHVSRGHSIDKSLLDDVNANFMFRPENFASSTTTIDSYQLMSANQSSNVQRWSQIPLQYSVITSNEWFTSKTPSLNTVMMTTKRQSCMMVSATPQNLRFGIESAGTKPDVAALRNIKTER